MDGPFSRRVMTNPLPVTKETIRMYGAAFDIDMAYISRLRMLGVAVDAGTMAHDGANFKSGALKNNKFNFKGITSANKGGPVAGGGAKVSNLNSPTVDRIQNIADKFSLKITVVGSRASGKADQYSDWDYIIQGGNSRARSKALYLLPKNNKATKDGDMRPGSEVLRGEPVDTGQPYITFTPSTN